MSICRRSAPDRATRRSNRPPGRASRALREQEHRTAIDHLRVALSRATETLAFVDVGGDEDAHALSADLLKDAAPFHADDLVEHFADDAPPDERVPARMPADALRNWRAAGKWQQAVRLADGQERSDLAT